jgi:hypothetical protein
MYRVLVGRPEGKRPRGTPRGRLLDNINMDLREIGQVVWTCILFYIFGGECISKCIKLYIYVS